MKDVHVASVNNGVVLLSGKTDGLDQDLRAIENAYSVKGVHRVASELKTTDKSTRNPWRAPRASGVLAGGRA